MFSLRQCLLVVSLLEGSWICLIKPSESEVQLLYESHLPKIGTIKRQLFFPHWLLLCRDSLLFIGL